MHILYLSLRCPYPPQRGDRIRSYHFIRQLSKRHEITLVFFAESDNDIAAVKHLRPYCKRIEWVRFRSFYAKVNTVINFFSRLPLQVHYWHSQQMQHKINQLLQEEDIDLIHAQLFRMGQYVKNEKRITKILDLCDSLALNLSRRANLDCTPNRFLVRLEEKRVRSYEVEIMKSFDRGTVVAQFDKDYLLKQDESLDLSVVPMGVDLKYFHQNSTDESISTETDIQSVFHSGLTPEGSINLLFTGTMNYFPNSDAVIYFCEDILPLIQERYPDVSFQIVGNHPTNQVKQLERNSGVFVRGYVPDIRPYFEKATIFVAPLRAGSGIQTKNLEAMAMQTPVVTTSIGAMGLEAEREREIVIADTPEDFAENVIDLIENRDRRESIARAGRKKVEDIYDWHVLVERLEKVYART